MRQRFGGALSGLLFAITVLIPAAPALFAAEKPETGERAPNRLIDEASPYLRAHAHNPVDWYPWGKEAFEKAARENKPILLSVGYSTCHWCHVMARESYQNPEVAQFLNSNFVAIKVDRERRPDVDEIYMLATEIITKHGGWPNNVFLTPGRRPFFAGTYFKQSDFKAILKRIATLWRDERERLTNDANQIAGMISTIMNRRLKTAKLTSEAVATAAAEILEDLDSLNGGFSNTPKFPQEPVLMFLLRLAERDQNAQALSAVSLTLDGILDGGIQDHVAGGFHRYAVDPQWRVPHFEKMLYNQAQLVLVLLRAHRLAGERRFAVAARRTLDYVLADLTGPEGGFYSARDADSEAPGGAIEEGAFYIWTPEQFRAALQGLDEADIAMAQRIYGVTAEGNYEGRSILHFPQRPKKLAADLGLDGPAFGRLVGKVQRCLQAGRAARKAPKRDQKIVTAWNGMMIAAFAEAAMEFDDARFKQAALRAGGFIWSRLKDDGGLKRIYFEGRADLEGQQEDYAFTALAFTALYDLTNDQVWLDRAEALAEDMVARFRDEAAGDYFMTTSAQTFARAKARTDSSMPSGNAAALELFARLARRSRDPNHQVRGEALLAALSGLATAIPRSSAYALMAGDMLLRGETGSRQFMAKGVVRAEASMDRAAGTLNVRLSMAKGWHINSNQPLEDFFVPTQLTIEGQDQARIAYPKAELLKLGFHDKELALYRNQVELVARLPGALPSTARAKLKLQACNDEICLEPETVELTVPTFAGPAS